ncbi:Lysosomal Pro-X carboxypeptidase [Morella rubra]|uniref:Lysosomal Pro-X carboxypeptidase n=1 Tax=Morella rubra TaxID=262757 RepID=A0A6A1WUB0_9ROSI|nr:Lysosomal Pro-X carboxypeptidase [Morella rubra]
MNFPIFILQWLPFAFLIFLNPVISTTSTAYNNVPRLSPIFRGTILEEDPETVSAVSLSDDFQTFFYDQTLDHFNYRPESYATFQQRYVVNSKYWGGANSKLTRHRYYGKSIPFGSREEALRNASTRGYFNSAQAIADYAAIIIHVKEELHAKYSPIIVIGGSYGGMLAAWFRLKYPHVALGALASSAPILYLDDITPQDGYYSIVTENFREASQACYQTIKKSWSKVDQVAAQPNGLSILSQQFNTCKPQSKSSQLKDFLQSMYATAAQYNINPPKHPRVTTICGGIDGAPSPETDILGKIFAGVVAYLGEKPCYTCSDLVIPIGITSNQSMFQPDPFSLSNFVEQCRSFYGVPPRPHWVTTYYGGHDIKLILHRFGSNIIFSNGLKDPYSSGGVLANISDSIVAVPTVNGSHCLDILHANKTEDSNWLVMQRQVEVNIIKGWISQYYTDLHAFKLH